VRDGLTSYLLEVLTIPLFSRRQEHRLFREAAQGGPEANQLRARLVKANLRLAVLVARKYQGRGLSLEDLIMESNIGLLRAVEMYDYRKGVHFSTYAVWWMRKAIVMALERQARADGREYPPRRGP
jgi:RNA polymerase primary sigma factor